MQPLLAVNLEIWAGSRGTMNAGKYARCLIPTFVHRILPIRLLDGVCSNSVFRRDFADRR